MCFHSKQSKSAQELENRFCAKMLTIEPTTTSDHYNGFTFPKTPVIIDENPEIITHYHWGLIPSWAKDESIRQYTLNAKIETVKEKPSFKNSVNKRCLVLADGFYEWKWLDKQGRKKEKYLIKKPDNDAFAYAGLWSEWVDTETGEIIKTYTILTTEANKLMAEIHNHKKRMPIILKQEDEKNWLNHAEIEEFAFPYEIELIGEKKE